MRLLDTLLWEGATTWGSTRSAAAAPALGSALALKDLGLGPVLEIIEKPKNVEGFAVACRRWVVERTFA